MENNHKAPKLTAEELAKSEEAKRQGFRLALTCMGYSQKEIALLLGLPQPFCVAKVCFNDGCLLQHTHGVQHACPPDHMQALHYNKLKAFLNINRAVALLVSAHENKKYMLFSIAYVRLFEDVLRHIIKHQAPITFDATREALKIIDADLATEQIFAHSPFFIRGAHASRSAPRNDRQEPEPKEFVPGAADATAAKRFKRRGEKAALRKAGLPPRPRKHRKTPLYQIINKNTD